VNLHQATKLCILGGMTLTEYIVDGILPEI